LGESYGTVDVHLSARTEVFTEALRLVVHMLREPVVTDTEFAEAVAHVRTYIEHERENTRAQARVALMRLLYADGHPHSMYTGDEAMRLLRRVTHKNVRAFHQRTFSTVGSLLCVGGDLPRTLHKDIREITATLPSARPGLGIDVHPDRTLSAAQEDVVVSLKDKINVDTCLAIPLSVTRSHEAYHALALGVAILGGSFTSRLFTSLRGRQSLTYGAYASIAGLEEGQAGYLLASAIFPHDVFLRGRTALRDEVAAFVAQGVSQKEVASRKEEVVGKYKVGLATTEGLVAGIFDTLMAGRPLSYIDESPAIIEAQTTREVNNAIKEHLRYDIAVTAAAGAVNEAGQPLA
jgi:zinc protease